MPRNRLRRFLGSLPRGTKGGVSMLAAGGVSTLIGATALAVDVGSLYLAKRELQGAADAAALAAVSRRDNPGAGAALAIQVNSPDARLTALVAGGYNRGPDTAWDARFVPGAGDDAVRVTIERQSPLFFARIFTRGSATTISATATAARSDMAAFWIGSRLAAVNEGVPNALLSALTGSHVSLALMDYQALGQAKIELFNFSDALRTDLDMGAATFGETLNASVILPEVLRAMAASTRSTAAAAALTRLANGAPNTPVALSRLIDLGPQGGMELITEAQSLSVGAMAMLSAVAQVAGGGRQVALNLGVAVPGLGETHLDLAIGERPANSPWLRVTNDRSVVVRTAQTRMLLRTVVAGGVAPLARINLSIFAELASAEARMSALTCRRGESGSEVQLAVTPSVGRIALAEADVAGFGNFGQAMALRPATLLSLPLVSVSGFADVQLGGAAAQAVNFSSSDVSQGTVKTVRTGDVASASIGSLLANTQITVNP